MSLRVGFNLGPKKYFIFPLVAIPLSLLLILGLNTYFGRDIQPTAFALLSVEGGPETGEYRFTIALVNQNGTNGPADGYIKLKVANQKGEEVYSGNFRVKSEEFREVRVDGGARLVGFSWTVPAANLSTADGGGKGTAEIVFLSLYGSSVTGTLEMELP